MRSFGLALAGSIVAGTLAASGSWDASVAPPALAQAQPSTVEAIQTPPPVPGLDYPEAEVVGDGLDIAALLAATPSPEPGTAPGVDEVAAREGAVNTNLGGSDVAVTSEGGSYEVDAPKRRAKRRAFPTPQP
jgi:hypothetical protein